MKELSWTPIRKGKTFCSPACGHGCTFEAYLEAGEAAEQLVERLGKGWKAVIWENLGWHYRATKGGMSVAYKYGKYSAYLKRWARNGKTPELAVGKVIMAVEEEIRELKELTKDHYQ